MPGGTPPGRALGGLEDSGAQMEGLVDQVGLIGVGGAGVEETVEGEVDGVRGGVGEEEEGVEEVVDLIERGGPGEMSIGGGRAGPLVSRGEGLRRRRQRWWARRGVGEESIHE